MHSTNDEHDFTTCSLVLVAALENEFWVRFWPFLRYRDGGVYGMDCSCSVMLRRGSPFEGEFALFFLQQHFLIFA